jgi:hypothetical protein
MEDDQLRQLKYILESNSPWIPGKSVMGNLIPSFMDSSHHANRAILEAMKRVNDYPHDAS